jgi:phage terminase large subunit-like protein
MSSGEATVLRLVGVYDAEGTLRGELSYWVGARLGRAHCALCDVTHGLLRERRDWRECREAMPVPFDTYHLDDQPPAVRDAAQGVAPVVLAETAVGYVVLLGPSQLEACSGSVASFSEALDRAVAGAGLSVG